jgi:hypothetical protein
MLIHFTFNDGHGDEPGGAQDFDDLKTAKREALRTLVEWMLEGDRRPDEIIGTVAGADNSGNALFSVTIHITMEDMAPP